MAEIEIGIILRYLDLIRAGYYPSRRTDDEEREMRNIRELSGFSHRDLVLCAPAGNREDITGI